MLLDPAQPTLLLGATIRQLAKEIIDLADNLAALRLGAEHHPRNGHGNHPPWINAANVFARPADDVIRGPGLRDRLKTGPKTSMSAFACELRFLHMTAFLWRKHK